MHSIDKEYDVQSSVQEISVSSIYTVICIYRLQAVYALKTGLRVASCEPTVCCGFLLQL